MHCELVFQIEHSQSSLFGIRMHFQSNDLPRSLRPVAARVPYEQTSQQTTRRSDQEHTAKNQKRDWLEELQESRKEIKDSRAIVGFHVTASTCRSKNALSTHVLIESDSAQFFQRSANRQFGSAPTAQLPPERDSITASEVQFVTSGHTALRIRRGQQRSIDAADGRPA